MRLHRINTGRGGVDDITEHITHLARCGDHDTAVAAAWEAVHIVGGEVAVSALLAEVMPLIPTTQAEYLALADRECQGLTAIGLVSATIDRRQVLLTVAEDRVVADPHNAEHQRNLSIMHERLGDLAVAAGDATGADQHHRAAHHRRAVGRRRPRPRPIPARPGLRPGTPGELPDPDHPQ